MPDNFMGWLQSSAEAVDPGNPGKRNDNQPGFMERISAGIAALATRPTGVTMADVNAVIPQPATMAPPPVDIDSTQGGAPRYAREDHTHESRLQARTVALAFDANGEAVYTFPKPYPVSVTPIVTVTAHNARGATYRYDMTVLEGSTTNTKVTIILTRTPRSITVSLLGAVVSIFTNPAVTATANIMSRAPS